MPCVDPMANATHISEWDIAILKLRLNTATRVACEYLTKLEAANEPIPEYAKEWWENHKREDADDTHSPKAKIRAERHEAFKKQVENLPEDLKSILEDL